MKKPPEIKPFKPREIKERYKEWHYQKTGTLASRIDYEWDIYINKKTDINRKIDALDFLIYAFDIRDEDISQINAKLVSLMKDRTDHKKDNPGYIPGKAPKHLGLKPSELLVTEDSIDEKKQTLLDEKELLTVNDDSKQADQKYNTAMLSPEQRNKYRVVLNNGLFKKEGSNFDTRGMIAHDKKNYAAYVLTANGELLIFPHLGAKKNSEGQVLVHGSMNAGAPVVSAGELKIENGEIKAINTYSGHYRPSIFNVYRFLRYLSEQDVDISEIEIRTHSSLSGYCPGLKSKEVAPQHSYDRLVYVTNASDLYQVTSDTISNAARHIHGQLQSYTREDNTWYYIKDWLLSSDLTHKRGELAKELSSFLVQFTQDIASIKTEFQLNQKIALLETKLSDLQKQNNELSKKHGKDDDSGRLGKEISRYKSIIKTVRDSVENPRKDKVLADDFTFKNLN